DAGLEVALDQARRLLRPGARLLVLADPASITAIPATRWAGLARHGEVLVLLLVDRLEMGPAAGLLAVRGGGGRFRPVLADPAGPTAIPATRWAGLARHGEVLVLLLVDRVEMEPPAGLLAFRDGERRFELDLADPAIRNRWAEVFGGAVHTALEQLPGHGVRVELLPADAPSDAWLPMLERPQSQVA